MKLIAMLMAVLLFVVAFAGLSPPTEKDSDVAVISTPMHYDVQQVEMTAQVAPTLITKENIALTVGVMTARPYNLLEVNAVARSGSYQRNEGTLINYQSLPVEADVGMRRLI
jgi:hypothetical protein